MEPKYFSMIIAIVALAGLLLVALSYASFLLKYDLLTTAMRSVGVSIVTLAGISLTWDLLSKKRFLEEIVEYLEVSDQVKAIGIRAVYPDRDIAMNSIEEALGETKGDVKLLGGALTYFLHSVTMKYDLEKLIKDKANEASFSVKLLLPDPDSAAIARRQRVDGHAVESVVQECVDRAKSLSSGYQNVKTRLYGMDFHCFLVVTPDRAFFQPYDYSDRGHTALVIECERGTDLYRRYKHHFKHIWDDKETREACPG